MTAAELAAALGRPHREGREWRCLCPAHADHDPSLSITTKDGQLLVICRAGCDQRDVIHALMQRGLWEFPEPDVQPMRPRLNITATYDYVDENHERLSQVCRIEPGRDGRPKDFRQRRQNGHDWVWNTDGVRRVPYHLDELAAARASANGTPWRVYITEGEKDADRIRQDWHLLATTNPGGAGKWRSDYNPYFSGADVVILPDNDDQGQKHARQVATALKPVATSVRILTLTGLPPKGDISDWIDAGGSQATLEELVDDLPQPPPPRPTGPILMANQFVNPFTGPDWLIPGIIQKGRLYACTSLTGHGKTAVWLYNAAMIAAGRNIGNLQTNQGCVLYLAGENPEDLKARMIGMTQAFNLPFNNFFVLPKIIPLNDQEADQLLHEIAALGVTLALIILDTAASYFPGDDENNNVQAGNYGRTLRSLTQCPGNPAVIALSHPVKNALQDSLLPRGGGAFLNELDGNLTLWASQPGENATLHWQGKIRGPDFDPLPYRLKTIDTGYRDNFNHPVLTILAHPIDDFEARQTTEQAIANEDAVLQTLANHPKASLAEIAQILSWTNDDNKPERWKVQRALQALAGDKLVRKYRRKWTLTDAGKTTLKGQED